MTRIPLGNCMQAEAEKRIAERMQHLRDNEDLALEVTARQGLKCADQLDAERRPRGYWETMFAPEGFYDGMAALRLLQERHGDDYALKVMGVRKPKTLLEKAEYSLTGQFPILQTVGVQ